MRLKNRRQDGGNFFLGPNLENGNETISNTQFKDINVKTINRKTL